MAPLFQPAPRQRRAELLTLYLIICDAAIYRTLVVRNIAMVSLR
jgi:hypothetical protein